jgi:hypothetical protein
MEPVIFQNPKDILVSLQVLRFDNIRFRAQIVTVNNILFLAGGSQDNRCDSPQSESSAIRLNTSRPSSRGIFKSSNNKSGIG